jgi:hypothetical protein
VLNPRQTLSLLGSCTRIRRKRGGSNPCRLHLSRPFQAGREEYVLYSRSPPNPRTPLRKRPDAPATRYVAFQQG